MGFESWVGLLGFGWRRVYPANFIFEGLCLVCVRLD